MPVDYSSPKMWQTKMPPGIAKCPLRGKTTPFENPWPRATQSLLWDKHSTKSKWVTATYFPKRKKKKVFTILTCSLQLPFWLLESFYVWNTYSPIKPCLISSVLPHRLWLPHKTQNPVAWEPQLITKHFHTLKRQGIFLGVLFIQNTLM